MESGQHGKWSKWKVVKMKSGQNEGYRYFQATTEIIRVDADNVEHIILLFQH